MHAVHWRDQFGAQGVQKFESTIGRLGDTVQCQQAKASMEWQ